MILFKYFYLLITNLMWINYKYINLNHKIISNFISVFNIFLYKNESLIENNEKKYNIIYFTNINYFSPPLLNKILLCKHISVHILNEFIIKNKFKKCLIKMICTGKIDGRECIISTNELLYWSDNESFYEILIIVYSKLIYMFEKYNFEIDIISLKIVNNKYI